MKFKPSVIAEKAGGYVLPYILTAVLNSSILGVFNTHILTIYNLISLVIILLMFLFFEFLKKHRIIGGIIYVFLGITALYLMMRFIFRYDWGEGFSQWFLTGGTEGTERPEYYFALVSVFPFFLSSVIYYFSTVLYRTFFLMLASLVPCAVYVKVLSDMNDLYLVLIVGLNAALYCINSNKIPDNSSLQVKKARSLSVLMITSVSLLAASLIPKQGEAVFYDKFESVFMNAGSGNDDKFNLLGNRSGSAADYRNMKNTPLYDLFADNIVYLRRQCFDLYDPEEHCWYPLKKYSQPVYSDINQALSINGDINYDDMLSSMKLGASLDSALAEITPSQLLSLESTGEIRRELTLIPLDFNANYVPTPVRAVSYSSYPRTDIYLGVTLHKQLTTGSEKVMPAGSFTIGYMDEFSSRETWLENGGSDFTDSSYSEYLQKLTDVLIENAASDSVLNTVEAFRAEFENAISYKADYSFNNSEIPASIAELARQITAGCEYDWQKASAIQEHFQSGEYQYDITYTPPMGMNTVEYFVFTSKKGTCSDFATAYTLMARSVGLTVRYTEGYSPDITSDEGVFRIRSSGSHAYPEVYIQNAGWLVFEPTVASMYSINFGDETASNANNGIDIDTDLLFTVLIVICGISAAAVIIVFSIPAARVLSDEIKISRGGVQAVLLIYRRLCEIFGRKYKINTWAMTPSEFGSAVLDKTGQDMERFILLYERVCFGGAMPSENDIVYSKEIYKSLRKAINNNKEKSQI